MARAVVCTDTANGGTRDLEATTRRWCSRATSRRQRLQRGGAIDGCRERGRRRREGGVCSRERKYRSSLDGVDAVLVNLRLALNDFEEAETSAVRIQDVPWERTALSTLLV